MSWHAGQPHLKLTGHPSPERIDEIACSQLVDVAYVVEATSEAVYFVADDPAWPTDEADFEWLCSVIRETLAEHGILDVALSLASPSPE
jgi:hypothetical protein